MTTTLGTHDWSFIGGVKLDVSRCFYLASLLTVKGEFLKIIVQPWFRLATRFPDGCKIAYYDGQNVISKKI